MKEEYQTNQRKIILDYIKKRGSNHFTVNDINNYFKEENIKVGLTTIYRNLESLVNKNLLHKTIIDNKSPVCYQLIGVLHHYHLKCNQCGSIIHMKCDLVDDLTKHIYAQHKFEIDNTKTILYGTCSRCSKER